eukprot:CAMPEP_0172493436 /NCGR_PEP_ID=MMETSP1066-20121228/24903_1 /TAXON_ID=671091 /ORGANISM="Coscinodiscus wailesii, Strain CCMP2513" /LENGTH=108 /DNA_ID=CAMNT_0013263621 /DNA_START=414 /DNA_END=740 /DNA_ORIENTATION=-
MYAMQDKEVRIGRVISMMERDEEAKTLMERIQEEIEIGMRSDEEKINMKKNLEQRLQWATKTVLKSGCKEVEIYDVEKFIERLTLVSDETIRVLCKSGVSVQASGIRI